MAWSQRRQEPHSKIHAVQLLQLRFLARLISTLNTLRSNLSVAGSSYIDTPSEQAQFNQLTAAASSGNFAGAVAAANQLAKTAAFLGITNANGTIDYQSKNVNAVFGSDWRPNSLNIQNSDGTSQITTYNSDGSSTTTVYSSANGTGSIIYVQTISASGSVSTQVSSGQTFALPATSTPNDTVTVGTGSTIILDAKAGYNGQIKGFSKTNALIIVNTSALTDPVLTVAEPGTAFAPSGSNGDQWLDVYFIKTAFGIDLGPTGPANDYKLQITPLGGASEKVTLTPIIAAGTTWTVSGATTVTDLINNGTIVIGNGASFQVTDRLVEGAGSTINGVVSGAGAGTTIELASGKSGSIASGLSNIGTIAVDAGASWTVTGSYSLPNIVDNGTISTASGSSLQVTSRLVEGAGSAINGVVSGAGAGTTIELVSGKSGTIASGLSNIGTIAVDAGASWTVTGSYSLPNIVDNGTIVIASGSSLDIFSALDPASTGIFQLQNNSTLELAAALGHNTKMQFLGSTNDKLVIDKASSFGTGSEWHPTRVLCWRILPPAM